MAVYTGTVTGHLELLDELRDNALLSGWTQDAAYSELNDTITERGYSLRGPDITVGINTINAYFSVMTDSAAGSYYNFIMYGAGAFDPARNYDDQPISSPQTNVTLWDQTIQYWMFINDRAIVVVAKITTVYVPFTVGLILPDGTANEYPYPLYVCGNTYSDGQSYTLGNYNLGGITSPCANGGYMLLPSGSWREVQNFSDSAGNKSPMYTADCAIVPSINVYFYAITGTPDGQPVFLPCIMSTDVGDRAVLGTLHNVFHVVGESLTTETISTIDGDDYIIFQTNDKVTLHDYYAVKMI